MLAVFSSDYGYLLWDLLRAKSLRARLEPTTSSLTTTTATEGLHSRFTCEFRSSLVLASRDSILCDLVPFHRTVEELVAPSEQSQLEVFSRQQRASSSAVVSLRLIQFHSCAIAYPLLTKRITTNTMRRSGSSSCMLRPKSVMEDHSEEPLSVTLINTQPLPMYSTERFYMLSELELKAHSTVFLCDLDDCDQTQDTVESSEASCDPISATKTAPFCILYLLWRSSSSARAFAEGPVAAAIQQWNSHIAAESSSSQGQSLSGSLDKASPRSTSNQPSPRLYLVVDMLASSQQENNNDDDDDSARRRRFQVKVDMAEQLARHVAQSQSLRSQVDGITVGVSDHVRAAPGLATCLDSVSVGARDRRRLGVEKSLLGLVATHPDDLLGLQEESVTDAAQGVLQSCTCAEWNGNGNLQSFARRAHSAWCAANHVVEEDAPQTRRRRRRSRGEDGDFSIDFLDPITSFLVIFVLAYLVSHLWGIHSDTLQRLLTRTDSDSAVGEDSGGG